MTSFSTFASGLLSRQSHAPLAPPSFYSTRESFIPFYEEDDILGASVDSVHEDTGRRLSFGGGGGLDSETTDERAHDRMSTTQAGSTLALPSLMSRFTTPARFSRGWKAYESIAPTGAPVFADEVYSDEDEDDDSPPGAFLTTPIHPAPPPPAPADSTIEPLIPARTLFVYGHAGHTGVRQHTVYQDSAWIVAYGLSLLLVLCFGVLKWWNAPVKVRSIDDYGKLPLFQARSSTHIPFRHRLQYRQAQCSAHCPCC